MRKILSFSVLVCTLVTIISPAFALMARSEEKMAMPVSPQSSDQIDYPAGEDFSNLKSLIETNFSKSDKKYGYNCIVNNTLCPNYKYTSVIEKAIKLIILKTYTGNEEFYNTIFINTQSYGEITNKKTLKNIIDNIPHGSTLSDWKSLGFSNTIGGEFLDASFGVDFTENADSSSMLGAIENKIKEMKRNKCQKENNRHDLYEICPWNGHISNTYLPTEDELYAETVYLNRGSIRIGSLKDDIEYIVTYTSGSTNPSQNNNISIDSILTLIPQESTNYITIYKKLIQMNSLGTIDEKKAIVSGILSLVESDNFITNSLKTDIKRQLIILVSGNQAENIVMSLVPASYTLRYKKDSYTLEEAKTELEKKETSNEEFIVTMNDEKGQIPCKKYTAYLVQSQCIAARASLKVIQTALAAYQVDTMNLPDSLDKLTSSYIRKFPQAFTDNFSYKLTKNTRGEADYEIRYIGHIGEGVTGSGETEGKKDYKAMMSGAVVPEIPAIFAHVPSDSMVLYVRNPANLIDLLNQKSNTSQRLSGIDTSESIRNLMKTFFELEKFEQIEKNLKHEMAIVVNNLDATAPDIVIILSESDREALSPTGKARVVGSKDGYIFIASSKESLEKLTSLSVEKSLKNAPDFQYVWWKKSALVKDALMFVGDEFFAKMLTLETYLTHYRKYRDYTRLTSLQELTWAYGDAFGKLPTGFAELSGLGLSTLTGEVLGEYSIVDGLVTHRNIGTLNSLKTLPEARYDLSKISRMELEDYKYNVLQYRDIWRASLDPMGIVINGYGDGMEVDFFMTPIPSSPDRDLMQMQKMFEGTTKDSLSFVTDPRIRIGLLSFVFGFDPQKLQTKIKSSQEIGRGFEEFSKEVLDGKNIFDYLGGEFAWSIGSLDPDIFEGWNVEKVDAYISVQVASEEKGKELIEMLKKKFIGEMSRGGSSAESSMFSMLAKPLIEDYEGKKIYYVEAIPVPWVGKIGLAYTFVDDFFIIGLNRSTIRHVIDTAASGDSNKKNLVSAESFEKGTFFATMFDGVNSSAELKRMYEKNPTAIPRFFHDIFRSEANITPLVASYYATEDRNKRLGKKSVSFHYELGSLSLSGKGDNLMIKIDPKKLTSLSGSTLEMWESIKKEPTFPSAILTEQGIPLEVFLSLTRVGDLISMNMLIQLDAAMDGSDSLLRNITFGMNMGNDEIGFRLRVFRQAEGGKGISTIGSSIDVLMIGGILIFLVILGGVIWFIIRRRSNMSTITALQTTELTSVPPLIIPQDVSPVIVPVSESSIIVPPIVPIDIITPAPFIQVTATNPIDMPIESVTVPTDGVAPSIVESTLSVQDVTSETK